MFAPVEPEEGLTPEEADQLLRLIARQNDDKTVTISIVIKLRKLRRIAGRDKP